MLRRLLWTLTKPKAKPTRPHAHHGPPLLNIRCDRTEEARALVKPPITHAKPNTTPINESLISASKPRTLNS